MTHEELIDEALLDVAIGPKLRRLNARNAILSALDAAGKCIVPKEPLTKLATMTPVHPKQITHENGWQILDQVQDEVLTPETRAMIATQREE